MDKAYDKFDVEMKSVQLLFARAGIALINFQNTEISVNGLSQIHVCVHVHI